MLIMNAFNLLPVGSLEGGHMIQVTGWADHSRGVWGDHSCVNMLPVGSSDAECVMAWE